MARAVLSNVLLARLRQMCDIENDTHLKDNELYSVLSVAVAETWDKIVTAGVGDEYVKSVTFNTVANQAEYPLATIVPAGDFYKLSQLYVNEGNNQFRPISRINPGELQAYRPPVVSVAMKLYYVPCAPVWTVGNESFDGINGWEEHTLNTAAVMVKKKKQDDFGPFQQRKLELERRIQTMANRSMPEPPRVVRKRHRAMQDWYAAYRNNVSRWDIRGINLELYYDYGSMA